MLPVGGQGDSVSEEAPRLVGKRGVREVQRARGARGHPGAGPLASPRGAGSAGRPTFPDARLLLSAPAANHALA